MNTISRLKQKMNRVYLERFSLECGKQKGGGSSVFEPSKGGGLCNFDLHVGGGSSSLYTNFKLL